MTYLYVGIDAGSESHTVVALNENNHCILSPMSISNEQSGAAKLVDVLVKLCQKNQIQNLWIATEATNFYDWHLLEYLNNEPTLCQFGLKLFRFNPLYMNRFKKSLPRKGKTDKLDARAIARKLKSGELPKPYSGDDIYLPLRMLTRYRFHLRKMIVKEKNYFISRLFLKFSSFKTAKVFSNIFGVTSSAILTEFMSLSEIEQASMEELTQFIIEKGKNRFPNPQQTIHKLQYAINESYRIRPALENSLHLILAASIQNIRTLQACAKKIDKAIEKQLQGFRHTLDSINGFGPTITAGIIAEIGDIQKFKNHYQLASASGLVWYQKESGNFKAVETRLAKEGNKYLRYYIVEAADQMRKHSPYYKNFYHKKYYEVKKHQHKRALVLTARKVVKLVFAILNKGTIYKEPNL